MNNSFINSFSLPGRVWIRFKSVVEGSFSEKLTFTPIPVSSTRYVYASLYF